MCLGIPGKIVEITSEATAIVDICGVKRTVEITCVINPNSTVESLIGKWVLIHVGFAMSIIDEQEAQSTLDLLNQLGELEEDRTESPTEGGN